MRIVVNVENYLHIIKGLSADGVLVHIGQIHWDILVTSAVWGETYGDKSFNPKMECCADGWIKHILLFNIICFPYLK